MTFFLVSTDHYQQYDNMAYPETKGKSVWHAIKSVYSQTEKQKQLVVPTHDEMQEKCLQIYLQNHNKILRNCDLLHQLNITRVASEVFHIFYQLWLQNVCQQVTVVFFKAETLPEVSNE